MTTVFRDMQNELVRCSNAMDTIQQYLLTREDEYTLKGLAEQWTENTKTHAAFLGQMKKALDTIVPAMEKETQRLLDAEKPQATSPAEVTTAELQASRILARNLSTLEEAHKWIQDTPASPARTIVLDELKARGVITADEVITLITIGNPAYQQQVTAEKLVKTVVNSFIGPRIASLEKNVEHMGYQPAIDVPSVIVVQGKLDTVELPVTPQVPTFTPSYIDTFAARQVAA